MEVLLMENKKYFYGNEISNYGVQHNRVDYMTLANSFDAVLCNDITKLFYSTINKEFIEPEIVNGELYYYENENGDILSQEEYEQLNYEEQDQYDEIQNDIYQYFIIDNAGYRILTALTNEIVFYIESLDLAIWGVTHFGTSWDYVLTDIKIDEKGE
jgi:hypothetical protein